MPKLRKIATTFSRLGVQPSVQEVLPAHVYVVIIEHLLADGSVPYQIDSYGPYVYESAAKGVMTVRLNEARQDYKKATGKLMHVSTGMSALTRWVNA